VTESAGRGKRLETATLQWLDEHAGHGVFITDVALTISSWNRWLATHTGRSAETLVGQPLFAAWPELQSTGLDHYYRDALAGRARVVSQALHGHLIAMRPTVGHGVLPQMAQSARIAPLLDGSTIIGTITVIEDMSERAMREAALRQQIADLDEARASAEAALRVKDEFLTTLSHELRTPLNAVVGWTRILRSGTATGALLARGLEVVQRNADAQVRLIEDMLDMSRMMSGRLRVELRRMDIVAVAVAAVDVVAPAAATKAVEIRTQFDHDLPLVYGDPDRLQQVVWNLLSNAVKFTGSGGRIDLRLSERHGRVVLAVHDSGEGIAPEFLPHVFERFRQADGTSTRRHGGLGLGLALVRHLVELHGGTVRADSEGLGRGATFSVVLPAVVEPVLGGEAVSAGGLPGVNPACLQNLQVLAVDDDPESRELIRLQLEMFGAVVTTAATAAEALTRLPDCLAAGGRVALVADIGMPGEDGYALIRNVRNLPAGGNGRVHAVAVTAYAGPEDRARALALGFDAHFVKPVDPAALVSLLSRVTA
jgi:signal transduction histidine kinase/ActR/RegA family two-component response regulator